MSVFPLAVFNYSLFRFCAISGVIERLLLSLIVRYIQKYSRTGEGQQNTVILYLSNESWAQDQYISAISLPV